MLRVFLWSQKNGIRARSESVSLIVVYSKNPRRGLFDQKSGHVPFFDVNCIFIIYLGYWQNLG